MSERDDRAPDKATDPRSARLSRRHFLTGSGAALATTSLIGLAVTTGESAAGPAALQATPETSPVASPAASPVAAITGHEAMHDTVIAFFNLHEAATVEALAARILPGSPEDPGAREAGVVNYIDRALAGPNLGYERKTYTQGPFLAVSEEPLPVEVTSQPDIYRTVQILGTDAARYGYQSVMTPQDLYRRGLKAVDAYAGTKFGKAFVELTEAEQDAVLTDMVDGTATGFEGPTATGFFTQLRNDTIEGMFGDPMYGGNRDLVGWKLIGYPGAQRFYTPTELKQSGTDRQPQSLAQLLANEGH